MTFLNGDIVQSNFHYPNPIGEVKYGLFQNCSGVWVEGFFIEWLGSNILIQELDFWKEKDCLKVLGNIYDERK